MRWHPQTPPTNQLPQQLRVAIYYSMASISSERIAVGGAAFILQERLLLFYYFYCHMTINRCRREGCNYVDADVEEEKEEEEEEE